MKKTKKLTTMLLVLAMLISTICIPTVSAANPSPIVYNFDESMPSFLTEIGATQETFDGREAAKIQGNTSATGGTRFTFDATSLKPTGTVDGTLTYSFVYRTEDNDTVENMGIQLRLGQYGQPDNNTNVWTNHIGQFYNESYNRGGFHNISKNGWHKLSVTLDFDNETDTLVVDDGTPIVRDTGLSENINTYNLEMFKLCFQLTSNDSSYVYIDDLKAEYKEKVIPETRIEYNFDESVPSFLNGIAEKAEFGGQTAAKILATKTTVGTSKTGTRFIFDATSIKPTGTVDGVLTYSFKYRTPDDTPDGDMGLTLRLGDYAFYTASYHNHLGEFYNEFYNRGGAHLLKKNIWHTVTATIDFKNNIDTVIVDGNVHCRNTGISACLTNNMDMFKLYFDMTGTAYVYIDDLKAEYKSDNTDLIVTGSVLCHCADEKDKNGYPKPTTLLTTAGEVNGKNAITASASIYNGKSEGQTIKYILAMYNADGALKTVLMEDVDVAASTSNGYQSVFDTSGVDKSDVDQIKLFIWDGLTELTPLGEALIFAD